MAIPNSGYFCTDIMDVIKQKSQYVGMLRLPSDIFL